jgi:aspartate/methionine/tyrosine aminotransferase
VPQPSYPLFEHLTRLDGVETRAYRLERHGAWTLDDGSVARAVSPRTRAILAVSPNNPTGSFLTGGEIDALGRIAAERGIALIGDEVFADYQIDERSEAPSVLADPVALTFGLGGLSKSAGLPQLKLGWMGIGGPDALVSAARARLELICDTYLSVSTPVQQAAGALIAAGRDIRSQILERVRSNHRDLECEVAAHPACTLRRRPGGGPR